MWSLMLALTLVAPPVVGAISRMPTRPANAVIIAGPTMVPCGVAYAFYDTDGNKENGSEWDEYYVGSKLVAVVEYGAGDGGLFQRATVLRNGKLTVYADVDALTKDVPNFCDLRPADA